MLFNIALVFAGVVVGWLVASFFTRAEMTTLKIERDNYERGWNEALTAQRNDLDTIATLQDEITVYAENAERYALVRYFLENDHGELAIEAFFGPQAILDAGTLDNLLDEELDQRYLMR